MFTKDRDFYKSFIALAMALMAEQAVILSVNLIDNVMLGAYAEASLSGVAAVNQIQFVLQQIVYGISNAMIVLGSQYWGQKRIDEIKKLSAIGARASLLITLILFSAVSVFPGTALALFTNNAEIAREGVAYLDIIRWSYVFFGLTTVMLGTLRIVESVKIALRVSVVSLLINVCINYLLIFGRLGFPEMGVRGAAIGTLTARIVELFIVAWFLFRRDNRLSMRLSDYRRMDRSLVRDYVRVGTPVILAALMWGFNNAAQTMILGHMDKSAIAAQSISVTLYNLLKVTSVGAASAASILIGRTVGAGNMNKVREYTRTLQLCFLGIGLALAALFAAIGFPLLGIYKVSEETRVMAPRY